MKQLWYDAEDQQDDSTDGDCFGDGIGGGVGTGTHFMRTSGNGFGSGHGFFCVSYQASIMNGYGDGEEFGTGKGSGSGYGPNGPNSCIRTKITVNEGIELLCWRISCTAY